MRAIGAGHLSGALAAIHRGADIGRPDQRDTYISAGDANSFLAEYPADSNSDDPNLVLRIVHEPMVFENRFVPPIIAVLELLDAADTRAAAEALRLLR